uniref:Deoxynucleoside kinase n=1 Tax=Caligus rogercresseyi TaxID=217165 RepID=C1BMJ6_CALRO|nr:Deoxynucleoside kinase [Caligus rogercresseyi]
MSASTVCVEGNIASGKTTFLKLFEAGLSGCKSGPSVRVVEEPVSAWQNLHGHNILELMYKDPSRWGHLFQSYVALTMTQVHTMRVKEEIKLMERSLLTAEKCFAANLYNSGNMSEAEYRVLKEWYAYLNAHHKMKVLPDLIVYLQTTPETCLKRVISRSRHEESTIPLDYLRELHELHEACLIQDSSLKVPVLVVDAENNNFLLSPETSFKPVLNQIMDYYSINEQNDKENCP